MASSICVYAEGPLMVTEDVDSTELSIRFRIGKAEVDRAFNLNSDNCDELKSCLQAIASDSTCTLSKIHIISSASPEGPYQLNMKLSERRAESVKALIKEIDPSVTDDMFEVISKGEDWDGAIRFVEESDMKDKDEVLDILRNIPQRTYRDGKAIDSRKQRITDFKGGSAWNYMLRHYYPSLRKSQVSIIFETQSRPAFGDTIAAAPSIMADRSATLLGTGSGIIGSRQPGSWPEVPFLAVKTNALSDIAFSPNIALEIPIGERISTGLEYTFPWWVSNDNARAWELLNWNLFGRYWFGDRIEKGIFTGPFAGIMLQGGYYDIEPNHTGYQGEHISIGAEFGWSWQLSKHWFIEASAGLGWMGTNYRYYKGMSDDQHLVYQYNGRFNWIGPVKVDASIVYLFYHKYKGGGTRNRQK